MEEQARPIGEDEKRALVEHFVERVIAGISGRDGEDLVDIVPSRSVFAGVLRPVRAADVRAARTGMTADPPSGNAIGLDFRILPKHPDETVHIRVRSRWSHYYAVFPIWEQLGATIRPHPLRDSVESPPLSVSDSGDSSDLIDQPGTEDGLVPAADMPEIADEQPDEERPAATGQLILPRVFRRFNIVAPAIAVDLPAGRSVRVTAGETEYASVIEQAQRSMLSDPFAWRHLSSPEKRERSIGDRTITTSAEKYAEALAALDGEKAPLPPWSVGLEVESGPDTTSPDALRVRVLLVNTTPDYDGEIADPGLQERSLLDAGISIEVDGGVLFPFDFLLAPKDYRSKSQMPAKGVNCAALWLPAFPNRIETETVPIFRQKLYRTKDNSELPFANLDGAGAIPELDNLGREMRKYLALWDGFLSREARNVLEESEIAACARDRDQFDLEVKRFQLGVETLRRDAKLFEAFRLMNRVFGRLAAVSNGRVKAWRLFQIGFIVSQLPSLAARELPTEASDDYAKHLREAFEEVGVLWFPTGGGKTEAYLGLIATALLYDRLRGKTRGVSAWMRFPLRMLSLQQLERLARVVAALNTLRAENADLQSGDPFATGYYVGDAVTPNSLSEDDIRRYERDGGLRERARLLRKCPFCGAQVNVEVLRSTWRLAHVCGNPDCFSNTSDTLGSLKGSLPLYIVDNEIYRYLPSVLIGTVDKLAVMGRNRYFSHIVRGANQRCRIHGYTSYDECIERWGAGCGCRASQMEKLPPMKDPGPSLLLQDELHLLKAELGVFNSHYEGLLRFLGSRAFLPPKVLAATATIEAYDTHAFHMYLSRARRYPQPAWANGESFYATSTPETNRRYYVGVLGHTRAVEEPALRLLAIYWREIRRLQLNPREAAQIIGRADLGDEEILAVLRLYDLSLAYVNRKATGGSLRDKLTQVDDFLALGDLAPLRSSLLTGDQTIEEVGATLERIEAEREDTGKPRLEVVVATNLISHGVDLERINMMVVCGMPSHYAEYVQSTSRAARSHPGIVFTVFKESDTRELSQYEFFPAIHENMDRLVEAIAVNRFASFAPQKTVPGILTGLLLCAYTPDLYGSRITKPLDDVATLQTALGMRPAAATGTRANCVDPADLQNAIEEVIGVDKPHPPASTGQIDNLRKQVEQAFADQMGIIGRTLERRVQQALDPLISFRDVDEGVDFASVESSSLLARLRTR